MKSKYIAPNIEVASFVGDKKYLEGGYFGGPSHGTDLGDLAKKRGNFYEEDEHEEESDSRFYKELW